jgi:tetratricopeptide (TPR) repeat protein
VQGLTHLLLGNLTEAHGHFDKAIEQYHEEDFRGFAEDYGVAAQTFAGLNQWLLGYPDQALRRIDKAQAHALSLNKPLLWPTSACLALGRAALLVTSKVRAPPPTKGKELRRR